MILGAAGMKTCSAQHTHRLYQGITIYVNNPQGRGFAVGLDVRGINLFANDPREVLFKVYDPNGQSVVREVIPDDGVTSGNFPARIGGWDHELQYYADLYARGTTPSFSWSAWSDPNRLQSIVSRSFNRKIKGGKKGIYRIVLAGTRDHYVTLKLDPNLKFGVAGHHTRMHGHGNLLSKSYIYIPKGTDGIFFAVAEPDEPRFREVIERYRDTCTATCIVRTQETPRAVRVDAQRWVACAVGTHMTASAHLPNMARDRNKASEIYYGTWQARTKLVGEMTGQPKLR